MSEYAKFVIAISWASSLVFYNARGAPLTFRKRLNEDEKKMVACCHMMIVYALLRWMKHKSLPSPHNTTLPPFLKFIPNLLLFYIPTLFLEEFIHFLLLRHFVNIRNSLSFTIRGHENNEIFDENDLGILENYCKFPHHVAHRPCMFRWYTMGITRTLALQHLRLSQIRLLRIKPTCPSCRGKLILEILQKDLLDKEEKKKKFIENRRWKSKFKILIKEWRNVMNWKWIIMRSEVTLIFILIVWRILKWRETIMQRNQTILRKSGVIWE
ncbi:1502_t:CDS:2 [Diversispora eburnea]|uniref:1502_t:CDS:1 n=1 Tax=Diversispora eburnea TaxID=1213867 RepID=A0A9N9G2F8_9GLOM|nr:1502_t:CDS:2 [Diversispora eburnea]